MKGLFQDGGGVKKGGGEIGLNLLLPGTNELRGEKAR